MTLGKDERIKVYLDHLIKRQSLRYVISDSEKDIYSETMVSRDQDKNLRYDDIRRKDGWFSQIRKPDFQRETNSWSPRDCMNFLDSVVTGRIIPSIILWNSHENGLTYVLDGAHRLSVIRAWMFDDWGDKSLKYYRRKDTDEITSAATVTRDLVKKEIGLFSDYENASKEYHLLVDEGKAPKQVMAPRRFLQAQFINQIQMNNRTLYLQWETGDYESAEQSFLRINRSGQPLDPIEANLIEYRNSSYARAIMSIANGNQAGHYWPEPSQTKYKIDEANLLKVKSFPDRVNSIYKALFVPPFKTPITDLNVPLMIAPAYFQKHKYLFELIPLVADRTLAITEDQQIELLKRDANKEANTIIDHAEITIKKMEIGVKHLIASDSNSSSLAIVPLFYFYNQKTKFSRGLLYGFVYWLLSGSEADITRRKLIFSANRERFEDIFYRYKTDIFTLQEKSGAGLKSVIRVTEFLQSFLQMLNDNVLNSDISHLDNRVIEVLQDKARIRRRPQNSKSSKTSRAFSKSDKNQINARNLFQSSIRCHICGGIVNLNQGLQYDQTIDYAISGITDPETGEPTHPFCNRNKQEIFSIKKGKKSLIYRH